MKKKTITTMTPYYDPFARDWIIIIHLLDEGGKVISIRTKAKYDALFLHLLLSTCLSTDQTGSYMQYPIIAPKLVQLILHDSIEYDPNLVIVLALLFFVGLTVEEIELLDPSSVVLKRRVIWAEDNKEGPDTRIIDELPNTFWRWAEPWGNEKGKLEHIDTRNLAGRINRIISPYLSLGNFPALARLTFASNLYVHTKDLDKLSEFLDIPPHQLAPLANLKPMNLEKQAAAYFGIEPPKGYERFVRNLRSASQSLGPHWPSDRRLRYLFSYLPASIISKSLGVTQESLIDYCLRRGITNTR